jgi:hypothetical protein
MTFLLPPNHLLLNQKIFFSLLLYLLGLFLQHLLVMSAMCYSLQFHLQLILLIFDMKLQHFVFLLQIFHLIHLLKNLKYLNHLVLLIHSCLNFLFLFVDILLLSRLIFQIFYQSVPM